MNTFSILDFRFAISNRRAFAAKTVANRKWSFLRLTLLSALTLGSAGWAENKPAPVSGSFARETPFPQAAKTPEPVKAAEIVFPKSVFAENSPNGKDPFFPNSTRRNQIIPRSDTNVVTEPTPFVVQITLKGISQSASRRYALINNATFAAGETGEVRCGLQLVKVRCLEIRAHSALIEILALNEVRELKLREGI